jgi:thiol-disulfide isomerase/thioredoxin
LSASIKNLIKKEFSKNTFPKTHVSCKSFGTFNHLICLYIQNETPQCHLKKLTLPKTFMNSSEKGGLKKETVYNISSYIKILIAILLLMGLNFNLSAQDILIKIHLRGVYESKISLMPLNGTNSIKSIAESEGIKNGDSSTITVSKDKLPGEFILRFDFKEKETSTPYPAEKQIIISNQNLELWVNPPYCNNEDSTHFQKGEKENTLFAQFNKENARLKGNLGLLQNVVMNYDNQQSKFYPIAVEEYEKRRSEYNQWLSQQVNLNKALFISHTFKFQYVPQISFKGTESEKAESIFSHYFDGIDFNDTLILKTTNLKEWMTAYVNMYGAMSKTESMRDSLLPLAGKRAIEKAKLGNPKVYGWMVDYFYAGFEVNSIPKGMAMLQQYIDDPNCLTSKKQQIIKRLDSMTKLVAGTRAPDFVLNYMDGSEFKFYDYKTTAKNKLLLFWSANCEHCQDLVKGIKEWYDKTGNKEKLNIVAVSLDETDVEVKKWESAIIVLQGWKHLRAKEGVNSQVANDYAILSTPVMFLIDNTSNKIVAIPQNLEQLITEVDKQ